MKTLVLYVFSKYNERVKYFFENGIFKDDNVDFIIICNNKKIKFEIPSYCKKLSRENIGFDFGGWSDALLQNKLYLTYDHFIFINSSVIGPFVPLYYTKKWTDIFLNGLKDNVKLFGSTINTMQDPLNKSHVQSYIFSMNKKTLEYLIDCEIFSTTNYAKTFQNAIDNKEILMSRKIIENKWNIGSLLSYYKDIDFTFSTKKPEDYNIFFLNNPMIKFYNNILWTKHELIFVKGNRCFKSNYTTKDIKKLFNNVKKLYRNKSKKVYCNKNKN